MKKWWMKIVVFNHNEDDHMNIDKKVKKMKQIKTAKNVDLKDKKTSESSWIYQLDWFLRKEKQKFKEMKRMCKLELETKK